MHELIEVTVDFFVHRLPPRTIRIRDYSRFDLEEFHRSLASLDWHALNRSLLLDERIFTLNHYLTSARVLHAPVRLIRVRRPPALWLSAPVRSRMRVRDAARRTYRSRSSVR